MQNPYGGGCLSTRELLCCSHTKDLICIPFGHLIITHYNSMILAGALALATPPRDSTSKVLSIGLGGGELHAGLMAYFKHMDVYSVDISSEVVHMAWEQFGMKHFVCSVHYLEKGEFAPYVPLHLSAVQGRTKYIHAHLRNPDCLSHIVIAEVWELIDALFNAKMSETRNKMPMPVQYDIIVFDAFDVSTSTWSAKAFEGESNIRSGYAILSMNKVRNLLTEDGSAVFHIHKDKNFLSYVDMLKEVFGDKNVVVFDISALDSIVVAANSVFFPRIHEYTPRNELQQCDEVDINFDSVQQCNYIHTHTDRALVEDFVHPCEHPETFYRNAHNVVDALSFPRKLRYAAYHALNCTGYA
ncbi:hypothetical protein EON65_16960 [archaeon]|nr:MAG: hypothetical protein EON65_16960 [archaeon]